MTGAGRKQRRRLLRDDGATDGFNRPGGLATIRYRTCMFCGARLLVSETPDDVILSPSAETHLRTRHAWPSR